MSVKFTLLVGVNRTGFPISLFFVFIFFFFLFKNKFICNDNYYTLCSSSSIIYNLFFNNKTYNKHIIGFFASKKHLIPIENKNQKETFFPHRETFFPQKETNFSTIKTNLIYNVALYWFINKKYKDKKLLTVALYWFII